MIFVIGTSSESQYNSSAETLMTQLVFCLLVALVVLSLRQEEFQYFYNLELVEKLSLIGADPNDDFSEEELKKITDTDVDNNTKVDDLLDKLLTEGNWIEEALNEIDQSDEKNITLEEDFPREVTFSTSLLYEILYWIFLVSFIAMLLFSLVTTAKYFLENPLNTTNVFSSVDNRANKEFVFFPGKV